MPATATRRRAATAAPVPAAALTAPTRPAVLDASTPRQADLLAVLNAPASVSAADLAAAEALMQHWYPFCYSVWQENQAIAHA